MSMLALGILLTGCGPKHITLADGKCLELVVGDTIDGGVTLHSYAGSDCFECRAFLTHKGCPGGLDFRSAGVTYRDYDRITKRKVGDDPDGPIERRVFISGTLIPKGATGAMLNVDHLA